MGLNAPETSAPAESSSSGGVYGAPQTYATPPPLNSPPMAGIPPPFSPLMSGFPPGYVIFSTSLSLGSHNLPLDHHFPDFLCQASHRMLLLFPQVVPHSHLHPSPLLECRLLAVLRWSSRCILSAASYICSRTKKSKPTATKSSSRASNVKKALGTCHSSP